MAEATATVTLTNRMGLHARPSTEIVRAACRFSSEVQISKDGQSADAKSVLELLMLAAECGSELTVAAQGDDAAQAVAAVVGLIESRFGELEVDR